MAGPFVFDRVKETCGTTGTGTLTLAGAVSNFQAFSVVGDGNTCYYAIVHRSAAEWEVGIGTYTAAGTTLARNTILASSNGGSAVNLSVGTKDVFITLAAARVVTYDGNGTTNKLAIWLSSSILTEFSPTQGSILFAGASGIVAQDNANLFWDDTNNILVLGTTGAIHGSTSTTRFAGDRDDDSVLELTAHGAGKNGIVQFNNSRGTHALPTIVSNGDEVGIVIARAFDGSAYQNLALMRFFVDGEPGANDMPGRIAFYTTPDGSTTLAERFRISSFGGLGIGGATFGTSGGPLVSGGAAAAPSWSALILPSAATANRIVYATGTNTWGESADLTYDGTDLAIGSGKRFRMQSQNRTRYLNSIAQVSRSTSQSINSDTLTAIQWNVEQVDTDGIHDNVTNNTRLTAPLAGKYLICANVGFAANAVGRRGLLFQKNGANLGVGQYIQATTTGEAVVSAAIIVSLAATDYVEVLAQQVSGGALNVLGDDTFQSFSSASLAYIGE